MMASRGMGAINPSKMPKAKTARRKDGDEFEVYSEGGSTEPPEVQPDAKEPVLLLPESNKPRVQMMGGGGGNKYGVGGGGRLQVSKQLGKDLEVGGYLEGGAFKPKGMQAKAMLTGAGLMLNKRFKKGGSTSKVNEAGNYTKPGMRKALFESIKGQAVQGTAAGEWSARKAQLLAKKYKAKGGSYK